MKLRFLMLLAGLALITNSAHGQKPTRDVSIEGTNSSKSFEQGVVSALNARLAATTRFSMTSEIKAELIISLMCVDMEALGLRSVEGGVCSYTINYYPQELPGLSVVLSGPAIATGGESFTVAEAMFQEFVKVSLEEKLKNHLRTLLSAIHLYEANKLVKAKP